MSFYSSNMEKTALATNNTEVIRNSVMIFILKLAKSVEGVADPPSPSEMRKGKTSQGAGITIWSGEWGP